MSSTSPRLARLGLTDDEIDRMQGQLSRILEAIGQLQSVDTSAVGPTAQVIALENVMRDDEPGPGLTRRRPWPMRRCARVTTSACRWCSRKGASR